MHVSDRGDDVGISRASADIPAHPLAYLLVRKADPHQVFADMAWNARLDLAEHRHRRTDLARRAIAALEAVMSDESGLHRMQIIRRAESFDRRHGLAVMHHGQRQAGIDASAVHDHRAGAALAV